jgi:hypothetical protein
VRTIDGQKVGLMAWRRKCGWKRSTALCGMNSLSGAEKFCAVRGSMHVG